MPALVVWERLFVAGDDLRISSTLMFLLRLLQICIMIPIIYNLSRLEHDPYIFVEVGCIEYEDNYWMWYRVAVASCFVALLYGIVGAVIEFSIWRISGMGTPTETEVRSRLVPLCKCNMVPMLMIRTLGFAFALFAMLFTEGYCRCVVDQLKNLIDDGSSDRGEAMQHIQSCPSRQKWFYCIRILVFTMACDVFFPTVTFCVVMRKRIRTWYRGIRPTRERSIGDKEKSWQNTCKRCFECSSIMTCYMFGGQKLTAGSYADVAIALVDFLDDEGSLDIVPSDIAAALICLVNVQKQKQIERKNELLQDSVGVFAKNRRFTTNLYKMFRESKASRKESKHTRVQRKLHNRTKSWIHDCALGESIRANIFEEEAKTSISSHKERNEDIETGIDKQQEAAEESTSVVEVVVSPNQVEGGQLSSEVDTESKLDQETEDGEASLVSGYSQTTASVCPQSEPELTELREFLGKRETMAKISFRLIHSNSDSSLQFLPIIPRVLSPQNCFDRLVLGEGARYCSVALAAYSWMLYIWTNMCTGCCELTADTLCGLCTCKPRYCHSSEHIIGDNACGWKQTAVLKTLGISESDFLYANFSNDVGVNPYIILVDRKWKTILLAIRGTLSMEDMISDVTISPTSLEECGERFGFDGEGEYCHNGILAGAKWVYEDLERWVTLVVFIWVTVVPWN